MKLLLDMGISPRTAAYLRAAGHDVVHLADLGLMRLSDPEVAARAEAEDRVVVTFDLDFGRIMALQRKAHPSIILFRLEQATTDQVNQQLSAVLTRHGEELRTGAIVVIDEGRIRVRILPVW